MKIRCSIENYYWPSIYFINKCNAMLDFFIKKFVFVSFLVLKNCEDLP